jgi:protein arginine kinase activator
MGPPSDPTQQLQCDRCRRSPARAHASTGRDRSSGLCWDCLRAERGRQTGQAGRALVRFFTLLARPIPSREPSLPTSVAPDTSCAVCGLTYSEFARAGMAGCPECYAAFEPAALAALRAWRGQ